MGFEPLVYIAHVHIITAAPLPTEPPRIYMPWSLFIAKSVQLFYLQCYYFFLNELAWMNNGIKLLHQFSIGLYPWQTILLLCEIYSIVLTVIHTFRAEIEQLSLAFEIMVKCSYAGPSNKSVNIF